MEVVATNFTLQSSEEQQTKILSYASLLNSLSFPIQIVILSRKLDISSYLGLLETQAAKAQNPLVSQHIKMYKEFVGDLVKTNSVLDKKFYLTLSYSFLEKGAGGIANSKNKDVVVKDAKVFLDSKTQSVVQELLRVGLKSRVLEKNELIELFYEIYNSDPGKKAGEGLSAPIVKGISKQSDS